MTVNEDVLSALERLRLAERERRDAISELRSLGVIRSRGLVCDIGEAIAAAHYEVELSDASNPGYDLVTKDGKKVQVRTLRCTPRNHRTSIGVMKLLYDLLLALRINEDFEPLEAIEVFSWTLELASKTGVRRLSAEELSQISPLVAPNR